MKSRSEAISDIVSEVMAICPDVQTGDGARLTAIVGHYYKMAAGFTGFSELPDALLPPVCTASVRAWRRRGAEALSNFSGIGVSESYIDIEKELKNAVRKMKNPTSPVIIEEEKDA